MTLNIHLKDMSAHTQPFHNPHASAVLEGDLSVHKMLLLLFGWVVFYSDTRTFAHGAMGRRTDPSRGGPIELFLVPASAPRLV